MLVQATVEDAPRLFEIESEAFPADEAADLAGISFRIASAGIYFLKFMKEGDTLVGYVNGTLCVETEVTHDSMSEHKPEGKTLILHSVTIEASHRRQGNARTMLTEYVEQMKQRKYVTKILLLAKKHLCPFYESCGFTTLRVSPVEHGKESWYELSMDI
jgi:GNAT superfamily N-acetyltransferase